MYKITIEKTTETEHVELQTVYYKNGKKSTNYYDLDSDGKFDARVNEATGKTTKRIDTEKVFEQTLDTLDVAGLAVFLNQK